MTVAQNRILGGAPIKNKYRKTPITRIPIGGFGTFLNPIIPFQTLPGAFRNFCFLPFALLKMVGGVSLTLALPSLLEELKFSFSLITLQINI